MLEPIVLIMYSYFWTLVLDLMMQLTHDMNEDLMPGTFKSYIGIALFAAVTHCSKNSLLLVHHEVAMDSMQSWRQPCGNAWRRKSRVAHRWACEQWQNAILLRETGCWLHLLRHRAALGQLQVGVLRLVQRGWLIV